METGSIILDPETQFLASKQETGNEWELFKENVKPLKRGRNVALLNHALKSQTNHQIKASLLQTRRRLIEAIDHYKGDDPLLPWLQCIKWVQESFPACGDSSGLILLYEQCVRSFWHSSRYKDDLRYLRVWLQYAENCDDAQVIYSFLEEYGIGKTHAEFYLAYALHLESKNKLKSANDIFFLGLSRDAQPIHKLKDAYKTFLARSTRQSTRTEEDNSKESTMPARSFGTVLNGFGNVYTGTRRGSSDLAAKGSNTNRVQRTPLSVYNDFNRDAPRANEQSKTEKSQWIGGRAERNKENNAIPSKWTKYKIPQKPGSVVGRASSTGSTSSTIEVFVDEDCTTTEYAPPHIHFPSSSYSPFIVVAAFNDSAETIFRSDGVSKDGVKKNSSFQLKEGDSKDIKREAGLLRENPLRNFPGKSLPR
ncbi:Mitotic spindle checkpoint protein BUBR1 [Linum grandiflorum]